MYNMVTEWFECICLDFLSLYNWVVFFCIEQYFRDKIIKLMIIYIHTCIGTNTCSFIFLCRMALGILLGLNWAWKELLIQDYNTFMNREMGINIPRMLGG